MSGIDRLAAGPFRRPPLNLVVPPLALLERRVRGRWWTEQEWDSEASPKDVNVAVADRQPIDDGVGPVLHRRYDIDISLGALAGCELISMFCAEPNRFAPKGYACFDVDALELGSRFVVRLAGPWDGPVQVSALDNDSVRLVTLEGHMEAGWIEFSCPPGAGVFRIESQAASGDRGFWLLHDVLPVARWVQTDMWASVLEAGARLAGVTPLPRVSVTTANLQG